MVSVGVFHKSLYKIDIFTVKQAKTIRTHNTQSYVCIISLLCLASLIAAAYILTLHISLPDYCHIFIQANNEPVNNVNERFISLGLDSSVITDGFKGFNMTDQTLIKMIGYLSPAYLRIGGNAADQVIFCHQEIWKNHTHIKKCDRLNATDTFILMDSDWLKLHHLASSANVDIIYDLNSLLRYENGSWNPSNAEEMIQFSQDNGLVLNWELGNEPNSYEHKFNTRVNPTQLGIDYGLLRHILNKFEFYKHSFIVGPSTTRLRTKEIERYFTEFLISGSEAVNAVTWHHYYFSGINATTSEFLNPKVFNYLRDCIATATSIVRDLLNLKQPMWLGETASAWHAGAPNLSDRFIACFIWIDKLGLSARMGIDVVVRQSIFKGHYALLNDSYYPNPDWWLSILYNKLVDTSVIGVSYQGNQDEKIRLYVHCARNWSLWDHAPKPRHSTIVVFGVNIQDKTGIVKIDNLEFDPKVYVYEVTSESTLFSQYVSLNGQTLNLLPNLDLPDLKPKIIDHGHNNVFVMPAYSIVFWVFRDTNVVACMK